MAQMPPLQYGSRSPDGQWWWDGAAWQPVPPVAPPGSPAAAPGGTALPPPPAYAPPGYAPPVAYGQRIPGNQRSIGLCILLEIVTIGIYGYVWVYRTQNEVKRYSGIGVGAVLGLVIFLVISPVTFFIVPSEVRQMHEQAGRPSPVRGILGLWILLPLIGPIIWFVKVQGALNHFWASLGAPASGQTVATAGAPPTLPPPPGPPPGVAPPPPPSA